MDNIPTFHPYVPRSGLYVSDDVEPPSHIAPKTMKEKYELALKKYHIKYAHIKQLVEQISNLQSKLSPELECLESLTKELEFSTSQYQLEISTNAMTHSHSPFHIGIQQL
jgi:hypothetical protein